MKRDEGAASPPNRWQKPKMPGTSASSYIPPIELHRIEESSIHRREKFFRALCACRVMRIAKTVPPSAALVFAIFAPFCGHPSAVSGIYRAAGLSSRSVVPALAGIREIFRLKPGLQT